MALGVFLDGQRIGSLTRQAGGYTFAYEPEAVAAGGAGRPLLSHSLPLRPEPYATAEFRPYLEGLLPEGERRERIADELCVDSRDSYALIAELGRDCPGAAVFLPEGKEPVRKSAADLEWLDEGELEELLTGSRGHFDPLRERRMRFTLPGDRHKLALVHDPVNDRWAWPEAGAPSTHVVKPQPAAPAGMAANEMACTAALREMGLPVADGQLRTIAGVRCFVSRRFDRSAPSAAANGNAAGAGGLGGRVHQENFNQALGVAPDEEPSSIQGFATSRQLLQSIGLAEEVETLFKISFCNYLIGNGDSHRRNAALLLGSGGETRLAPFYDIASTAIYRQPRSGLDVFAEPIEESSCLAGMTRIAIPCDLQFLTSAKIAFKATFDLGLALSRVASRARDEGWYAHAIDRVRERTSRRVTTFHEELRELQPPPVE